MLLLDLLLHMMSRFMHTTPRLVASHGTAQGSAIFRSVFFLSAGCVDAGAHATRTACYVSTRHGCGDGLPQRANNTREWIKLSVMASCK